MALTSALCQILLFPGSFGFGAGWEPVAIARELARTGVFGHPYQAGESGPTAVIPPVIPLFFAALMKLLGDGGAFERVATISGMLAQAGAAALLPRVSQVFFRDVRPGVVAGLLSALAFRMMPQWDAPYTCCVLMLFFIASEAPGLRGSLLSGAMAGVLLLMNPATALITAPWVVYLLLHKAIRFSCAAAWALMAAIVAVPWLLRNEAVLGTFSLKDNFGMTAYASNNDCAQASLGYSIVNGCYDSLHPNKSQHELRLVKQMGEAKYDRQRTADFLGWVHGHPTAFARLTSMRVVQFWFPPPFGPLYCAVAVWLATALSIPGLVVLLRSRTAVARYFAVALALYPIPYYIVVSDVRYRYPILWISTLCAGWFLVWVAGGRARPPQDWSPAPQIRRPA